MNILYLVRSEIEKQRLREFQTLDIIFPGRIYCFDLMQKYIVEPSIILTKKYNHIYGVINTDCREQENINKLIKNISLLERGSPVSILAQNGNLNNELIFIFSNYVNRRFGKDIYRYIASYKNISRKRK